MSTAEAALAEVRGRAVDRTHLTAAQLDVSSRQRLSALPWRGQFTPDFAGLMIDTYAPREGLYVDPFAGSGTTLFEALRRGRSSLGVEVNPAAVGLARIFTLANLDSSARIKLVMQAQGLVEAATLQAQPIQFLLSTLNTRPELELLIRPVVLLGMGNGRTLTASGIQKAWQQLLGIITDLPAEPVATTVQLGDARAVSMADATASFILTSPPYINVFNYHQNYRAAAEELGWHVLGAARAEIGSNRKHRQNRLWTVIQYAEDMALALREMVRLLQTDAPLVLVVGRESKVRGISFPNGDILAALALQVGGLKFERWQERKFTSRFGGLIFEEVLTFRRLGNSIEREAAIQAGRDIGTLLLRQAARSVSGATLYDVEGALAAAERIHPSPYTYGDGQAGSGAGPAQN